MQEILKRVYKKHKLERYLQLILGVVIMALSFNLFILPNDLVIGGVSGLSIIFTKLVRIDPSLFMLIVDLFLLLISYIFLGREKTKASILGSILFPLFVKLTQGVENIISFNNNDVLLLVLFGGILYGLGIGLVFKAGFTTGGTDILNQIVSKYAKLSLGTSMLVTDGLIVLGGAFFFGLVKCMYAIIILYIISVMTDRLLLGISNSKAFYIITDKKDEVCDFVINELNHTITTINAKGVVGDRNHTLLFAVIPTKEYFRFKAGIKEVDENAFFTVVDAYEVMGGE